MVGAGTTDRRRTGRGRELKRLILCVDDFGLKSEINEAVAELADAGIVSATGCMTQGPAFRQGAALLQGQRRDRLDLGLHLNLTEPMGPAGRPQRAVFALPLPELILRALLRGLDRDRLKQCICGQLDAFEDAFGHPPDFVDGHQHVHQLPQVRQALLTELSRRYGSKAPSERPWLRVTLARRGGGPISLKHRVIEWLGGQALARQAYEGGFGRNAALLGVYGFDADASGFARRLDVWLASAHDGDLLMLHPAKAQGRSSAQDMPDAIASAREVEYAVLLTRGAQMLSSHGVSACRGPGRSGMLKT